MHRDTLTLDIAGDQIDGARDYQEDAFLVTHVDDGSTNPAALIAMADGVGGAAAGNIASQLVVNTFNRQFTSRVGTESPDAILRDALMKGNEALRKSIDETPGLAGMGCTVVTAAVLDGKLWWVSVGDSHLYVIRDGQLIKKNADHSYGAYLDMMEAAGTPVEPDPNLRRNMLMSAMSGDAITMIDCPGEPFELAPGDRIVVCSDGLDTLDETAILAASAAAATARDCVAALLQAVTDAAKPRQDNTTVVVCDVSAAKRPEAAEPDPVRAPEPAPSPPPVVAATREPAVTQPEALDPYALREREREAEEAAAKRRRAVTLAVLFVAVVGAAWLADHFDALTHARALLERPAPAPAVAVVADGVDAPDVETAGDAPTAPAFDDEVHAPAPERPPFRDPLRGGGHGPQMVALPAGSFMMGERGSSDPAVTPFHRVEMPAFAIGTHEITFAEYDRFARATARRAPPSGGLDRARHPVFGISWHDAVAYTEWLSRETGHRYSLPSESQWEYAASAGSVGPYWWGFAPPQGRAHCFGCNPDLPARSPVPVGSFEPNRFGLHDTAGNIAEWVQDCFHPSYRGAPADGSVWPGGDCSVRVVRGGHFGTPQPTSQRRDRYDPDRGHVDVGFRVVRAP